MIDIWSAFGKMADGDRLVRMQLSPQYVDGQFANPLPEQRPETMSILKRWLFSNDPYREPTEPLPVVRRTAADFAASPDDLRITWFGHSSMLVEIDGRRILLDPMWGDYASPGRLFGVKRFYAPPLPLDELPDADAVVFSHDHYDHLNEETVKAIATRFPRFIVPLGVGAHLEYWGVPRDRIEELDWWDEVDVKGVTLVCTPARHFSGRLPTNRNSTLWAGWAMLGNDRRVFFSGDTGMFPGFAEIGERLGPFDMTMIETGAYNTSWPDFHLGPEQAVRAHQMVRGKLMLPVHWGTFSLAFHGWTEPGERLLVAAERAEVQVTLPRPGESITLADPPPAQQWWPELPWKTAQEVPIVSTGLSTQTSQVK